MEDFNNINKPDYDKHFIDKPDYDKHWKCYLFGSYGTTNSFTTNSFVYIPIKGRVPNFIQRWFSDKFLGCKWVKEKVPEIKK